MRETDLLKDQRGSPAYISPDVLQGQPYLGKPSDMWALGVVLFTMLYGQFPFYDSSPQELFNKIKAAEYSIPDDGGRVSEDTKNILRKLLVVDPKSRMTATEVRESVHVTIESWRNMVPPVRDLQVVPECSPKEIKGQSSSDGSSDQSKKDKAEVLFNLIHGGGSDPQVNGAASVPSPYSNLFGDPETLSSASGNRVSVTRLGEDARPLTAEEHRLYGSLVTRMRLQGNPGAALSRSSTTGRPLVPASSGSRAVPEAQRDDSGSIDLNMLHQHVLISDRSPLLTMLRERRVQKRPSGSVPPVTSEPVVAPVPVMQQESVLDLSSPTGRTLTLLATSSGMPAPPTSSSTSAAASITIRSRQYKNRSSTRITRFLDRSAPREPRELDPPIVSMTLHRGSSQTGSSRTSGRR